MPDEVLPGIWWLRGTRGCNVFLARHAEGYALVDAGFPGTGGAILRDLSRLPLEGSVTHLLLTHRHGDHAGGAAEVREALGLHVVAGAGDCSEAPDGTLVIEPGFRGPRGPLARLLARRREAAPPVPVHLAVREPVDVVTGVEAVPLPGHTPGSVCYVMREAGVAFVGDLVISHRDGLSRSMVSANSDDAQYLAGLARFAERAPPHGLAGHGRPVLGTFDAQLRGLAASPREPLTLRNLPRRVRRMAAFASYVALPRR